MRRRDEDEEEEQVDTIYKSETPLDVLHEVLSLPSLRLSDAEVKEVLAWARLYNDSLPPDILYNLLKSFRSVSDKQASAIKDLYVRGLLRIQESLSVEEAVTLGLLNNISGDRMIRPSDIREMLEEAIDEITEKKERSDEITRDLVIKPLSQVLTNLAKTTDITNKFLNLLFVGWEEQIRRNPFIVGDVRRILPPILKAGERSAELSEYSAELSEYSAESNNKMEGIGDILRKGGDPIKELDKFFE